MPTSDSKTIVRRLFERLSTQNLALLDELFSPNVVMHTGADSTERSLEEIKQYSLAMVQIVPDLRFTIEDILAEGDKVSVRYIFAGTLQPMDQAPAIEADRRLSGTGMTMLRLTNGRITESWNEGGTSHRIAIFRPARPRPAPTR